MAENKSKAALGDDVVFSFRDDAGEVHTFETPTAEVMSPGWMRANRKLSDLDMFFTMIEELATPGQLKIIDKLSRKRFQKLYKDFMEHIELSPGE